MFSIWYLKIFHYYKRFYALSTVNIFVCSILFKQTIYIHNAKILLLACLLLFRFIHTTHVKLKFNQYTTTTTTTSTTMKATTEKRMTRYRYVFLSFVMNLVEKMCTLLFRFKDQQFLYALNFGNSGTFQIKWHRNIKFFLQITDIMHTADTDNLSLSILIRCVQRHTKQLECSEYSVRDRLTSVHKRL